MPGADDRAVVKAICSVPVQLYDEGLTGIYDVGDVLEGDAARQVLERYATYFVAEEEGKRRKK